ncbi:hypothetical protein [Jannaschia sp. 2305UL9-9]|uniref:hypothetical protein n=1 Tax=Jannaschia sp. 2305UL9-9 TaxID=3121638 RepID=UPI003527F002
MPRARILTVTAGLLAVTTLSACNMHNAGTAPRNISDGQWTAQYAPSGAPYGADRETLDERN